uniref:Uncharacterized protein n=1 Tax=Solanum tuberosum TaxID=4113 RepID=M1CRQ5_SOLTU
MISSQVQGPGPLQSMNTRPVVKVLNSCKSCSCQKVGEVAEYFTNQNGRSCLYIGQWLFMVDIFNTQTTNSLFIQKEIFQASKTAGT